MNNNEQQFKRRVRYKGKYPKSFKEKYKELNPEKYENTITRVIEKGNTPAGMHRSICVNEIIDFFKITPGQIGFDATLGYGGHTLEMLKCLEGKGHIYATDVDPIELPKTKERLDNLGYGPEILTTIQLNFSDIDLVALEAGKFDFVLADLGVSSMQIDNPDRGFSFKNEGPLDLRLNPEKGEPASERLKKLSLEELEGMLVENSDEPHAEVISQAIIAHLRKGLDLSTTTQLKKIISDTLQFIPKESRKEDIKKSCQRCFQALRIDVNSEFEVLYDFLEKLPTVLKEGGKVAILSFHSGEDRLVKKSFQKYFREGIYKEVALEPIRPSLEECNTNSRAKSTKLRWAIKA